MKTTFIAATIFLPISLANAGELALSPMQQKLNNLIDAEEKNPTRFSDLSVDFANYSKLSFDVKFQDHIRCMTVAEIGANSKLINLYEKKQVADAHAVAIVEAVKTEDDKRKLDGAAKALLDATIVYITAGAEKSFQKDYPACQKFTGTATSI